MHASQAFLNGAGQPRAAAAKSDPEGLSLLNALLSTAAGESSGSAAEKGPSKDERQADDEAAAETVSKPGGFGNDPDDPTNPNEVRERHLKNIKQ